MKLNKTFQSVLPASTKSCTLMGSVPYQHRYNVQPWKWNGESVPSFCRFFCCQISLKYHKNPIKQIFTADMFSFIPVLIFFLLSSKIILNRQWCCISFILVHNTIAKKTFCAKSIIFFFYLCDFTDIFLSWIFLLSPYFDKRNHIFETIIWVHMDFERHRGLS